MSELTVGTASASSTQGGTTAGYAFDRQVGTGNFWWASSFAPQWLQRDLGSGNATAATWYTISPYPGDTNPPTAWTFEGSNDASSWTVLDTRSGITYANSSEYRAFSFTNTTAYRYYRWNFTAPSSGSALAIAEARLGTGLPDSFLWGDRNGSVTVLGGAYTIGVVFVPAVDGVITHLRGYRAPGSGGGTVVFNLWNTSGTSLGSVSANESLMNPAHWYDAALTTPIAVTAGTPYMVSAYYPVASGYFGSGVSSDLVHGDIKIPANGSVTFHGSTQNIRYANGNAYPNLTAGSGHLVSVQFRPNFVAGATGSGTATAPSATATGTGTSTATGSGTATGPTPTGSGTGTSTATGSGTATAPSPGATGTGVSDDTTFGDGTATAPTPGASGQGKSTVTGSGTATGPTPGGEGSGSSTVTGDGTATAPAPTASGTGTGGSDPVGSGTATAPTPGATGEGFTEVEPVTTVEDVIVVEDDVYVTLIAAPELPTGTIPVLRESHQMPALSEENPVYQPRVDYDVVTEVVGTVHLWIGGVDVTYFRGVPTQIRSWHTEAPFGDKTAIWEMPQMEPWEKPGVGNLDFIRPDAEVVIGYVSPLGVVRRDWEGFLDSRSRDRSEGGEGGSNVFEAKGEMWAAMHHVIEPVPYMPPTDGGTVLAGILNTLPGRRFPYIRPTITGIKTRIRGNRDQYAWQRAQDIFAEMWTDDGRQWTMRKVGGKPRLALKKAMSDVAATVAYGTPLVEIEGTVDESSRVDWVWARGKARDGGEWANVYYPGLELITPPAFPNDPVRNIQPGDSDADTDTGTGVSDWQRKVISLNRWKCPRVTGVMTAAWVKVLRQVQDDLDITVDGSLGPQSWESTYGAGIAAIDLTPLRLPLVTKPGTMRWLYDSHGIVTGEHPLWDPTIIPREVPLDLGTNISRSEGIKACRTYQAIHSEAFVTGSVTFIGDPNNIDRTRLQVGDNLRILGFEGEDVTVQLASKTCEFDGDEDGRQLVVSFTFDERARDALTIDQILERNRASLPDPARRPGSPNRTSRSVVDEGYAWDQDSPCGVFSRVSVNGASGLWTKRIVPASSFGTIVRIFIEADYPFDLGIFANLAITPNVMRRLVGNPATQEDPWRPKLAELEDVWGFVEGWGAENDACGYSPLTQGDPGAPFTGKFDFRTPLDFITDEDPYLAFMFNFRGGSGFLDGRAYNKKDAG